jgi:hypothetical protein
MFLLLLGFAFFYFDLLLLTLWVFSLLSFRFGFLCLLSGSLLLFLFELLEAASF